MKLKRYPKYKPSGVEWLGDVPADWRIDRLKWTVEGCQNGIWGDEPDGEDDIVCIRVADFDRKKNLVGNGPYTLRSVGASQRVGRVLRRGDLLIEKSGGGEQQPVGTVVLFEHDFPAVCSNFVARMPVRPDCNPRFLAYLHAAMYAVRLNTCSIKQNTGIQNLDSAAYLDERAPIPALAVQEAVSDFLDRETAKIDTLIAKQEKLIELLQEKRQAVISHAVTRGLDPTVPMKPSGVEWLGEVPAHWRLCRAKHVSEVFVPQRNKPELTETEGTPWVTMEDMGKPRLGAGRYRVTNDAAIAAGSKVLPSGSVIASCVGSFGVSSINDEPVIINQQLQAYIPKGMLPDFLRLVVGISAAYFEMVGTAATLVYVNQDGFANLPVPAPPLDEQARILDCANQQSAKIDILIAKAKQAIELQKEHRTALISAAVTGKIDVRAMVDQDVHEEAAA